MVRVGSIAMRQEPTAMELHTHRCPVDGALWDCYDPDCTEPMEYVCDDHYPTEEELQ